MQPLEEGLERERGRKGEREGTQERWGLKNLVFNKAKEIIMPSGDYKAFNLEERAEFTRVFAAARAALGLDSLRRIEVHRGTCVHSPVCVHMLLCAQA